jgi:hypothetical protein
MKVPASQTKSPEQTRPSERGTLATIVKTEKSTWRKQPSIPTSASHLSRLKSSETHCPGFPDTSIADVLRGVETSTKPDFSAPYSTHCWFSPVLVRPLYSALPICPSVKTLLILRSLPKEIGARRHEIALVERGHSDVWITCRHSPRFIWKRRLNHHEAGLNLDFAAPGHIRPSRSCPAVTSRIIEVSGSLHADIVTEIIRLDYADDRAMRAVEDFNQRKTALFNSTMVRLNLPHRFDF